MQYLDVTKHQSYMALGKVKSSKHFQMQTKVFSTATSTPNDIMAAGEQWKSKGRNELSPLEALL